MEKNDAHDAASGSNEELVRDCVALYAILESAKKLINQPHITFEQLLAKDRETNGWVYNMKGLEEWIHYYTERRKLHCPNCNAEKTFSCTTCKHEFDYHDEL